MLLTDGAVPADGGRLVARAAVLALSMSAMVVENRKATTTARIFCLRDILLLCPSFSSAEDALW